VDKNYECDLACNELSFVLNRMKIGHFVENVKGG